MEEELKDVSFTMTNTQHVQRYLTRGGDGGGGGGGGRRGGGMKRY